MNRFLTLAIAVIVFLLIFVLAKQPGGVEAGTGETGFTTQGPN